MALTKEEEDKVFADNYRWLREQNWHTSLICVVMHPKQNVMLGSYCPFGPLLDELILKLRTK